MNRNSYWLLPFFPGDFFNIHYNDVCTFFCLSIMWINLDTEEEPLRQVFNDCGEIEAVRIVRDSKTGLGKGFGFILFEVSVLNAWVLISFLIIERMCTMYKFWNTFSDKNCYNVFMNTELWQRHPKCSQTSWVDTSSTLKDHFFRLDDLHIIVDNTGSKVTDETTMVCLLFKKIVKIVICLPTKYLEFL